MKTFNTLIGAASVVSIMVGCASGRPPNDLLVYSENSIRRAEEVGSSQEPKAARHLDLAKSQLQAAKKLIAAQSNERAEWVLFRAAADADLAIALTQEEKTRAEAERILQELKQARAGGTQVTP